jgi:hypothetical protein
MNLTKWSLLFWFEKKGKGEKTIFRPLLTEEQKASKI